jgi:hypothetical protein
MSTRSIRARAGLSLAAVAVGATAIWSPAGQATTKTDTLRYFVKDVSTTLTHADGSIDHHPSSSEPQPGDVLEINALDYKGDHGRHDKTWTASQIERCSFVAAGPPHCQITVAIAGSLLVVGGDPSKVVNGTGRYQGATGRVLSVKHGGTDVVARVNVR